MLIALLFFLLQPLFMNSSVGNADISDVVVKHRHNPYKAFNADDNHAAVEFVDTCKKEELQGGALQRNQQEGTLRRFSNKFERKELQTCMLEKSFQDGTLRRFSNKPEREKLKIQVLESNYRWQMRQLEILDYWPMRRAIEQLCQQKLPESKQDRDALLNLVAKLLPMVPPCVLNSPDESGQPFVHKLADRHWFFLRQLVMRGAIDTLDFSATSCEPDRHPGATFGHNLAGIAHHHKSDRMRTSIVRSLTFLYKTCGAGLFDIKEKSGKSVWDIMQQERLFDDFANQLLSNP